MTDRRKDRKRYEIASRLLATQIVRKTLPRKFFHLLGVLSDRILEKQFRVHRRTIARLRRLLKIQRIPPIRHENRSPRLRVSAVKKIHYVGREKSSSNWLRFGL